ncbi:glycosyltransferase family 2 protein [Helicobacter pullorum]|uniref:glycosyltransferase family 2 protein n=1 Tax=Helicobacter pullorum TaxID=35818 RepID=UPI000816932E|nr:glycosyltransferase family 2 protein [Helicobacter pullorum]OCR10522.1 hypothetical protein A7X13_01945 [Helicobacter pullorum]
MTISIIIPIYNVEKYLEECILSVINQTYKDLDIILVDDGSTDGSLQIAAKYAKQDKRIILISKPNGGLSSARNMGLEVLKGTPLRNFLEKITSGNIKSYTQTNSTDKTTQIIPKEKVESSFLIKDNFLQTSLQNPNLLFIQELPNAFVKFLDSDDYLALDCIEKLVKSISKAPHHDIVITHNYTTIRDKVATKVLFMNEKSNSYSNLNKTLANVLRYNDLWFAWSGIFNSKILNQYNLRFTHNVIHEDLGFGTILFMLQGFHYHKDYYGHYYRIRAGSIMTSLRSNAGSIPGQMTHIAQNFKDLSNIRQYYSLYCVTIEKINAYIASTKLPLEPSNKKIIQTILAQQIYKNVRSINDIGDFFSIIPFLKSNKIYTPIRMQQLLKLLKAFYRHPKKLLPNIIAFYRFFKEV